METRKQLRGNCQCCGRQQAVLGTGRISKHGYTVENHWFSGVCQGEHYLPLQKSRDQADEIVDRVRTDCDELERTANAYREGKAHPARIAKPVYRHGEDQTKAWEEATAGERELGIQSAIYQIESRVRGGRAFADMLEQLANDRHGQPLFEVEVETGPAPILFDEKRKSPIGRVLSVVRVDGQRVYWKDEKGFKGWTGSSAWRKYEAV